MTVEQSWADALKTLGIDNPATRSSLQSAAEIRDLGAGSTIIAQDDADDHVLLLLKGTARVVLLSADGQEIWLDKLLPGAVLGELAALTGQPRSSDIIAETDVTLAAFASNRFLDLANAHGTLGLALARILARRVQHTTQRMFELSALSAPGRIYAEFLRMSEGKPGDVRRYISPTPSLTAIARRVHTTRETVSRTVSDLEKRGLLDRSDKGFELLNPDQLSRMGGS